MSVIFSGRCSHDPERRRVSYEASIDGFRFECEIADRSLKEFFEDMGDPVETFISSRLAVLDLTRRSFERERLPEGLELRVERDISGLAEA
jgi:hypothetical protein